MDRKKLWAFMRVITKSCYPAWKDEINEHYDKLEEQDDLFDNELCGEIRDCGDKQ